MKQNTTKKAKRRCAEFAEKQKSKAASSRLTPKTLRGGVLFADEVDDGLGGGAGEEDFGDAGLFEGWDVGAGDDAADQDGDIVHAFFLEEIHELRADGVVGAGEDGEADDIDVFLDGSGGDHLRGLAEAGVDDFHAGVAEGAGDDFGAAVVAVEAGLGNQYANFAVRGHVQLSAFSRQL